MVRRPTGGVEPPLSSYVPGSTTLWACLSWRISASSTQEWESAVSRYRTLFTAFEIRPQDVFLRLPNRRLYIGVHVQEYLAGLDSEWERHRTRWVLAVKNRFAYRYRAAFVSGSGSSATERRIVRVGDRLTDEGEDGARRCCWSIHGEPPDLRRQRCHAAGALRSSSYTAKRRLGNSKSNRVCVYWCGKDVAGFKRQMRPIVRMGGSHERPVLGEGTPRTEDESLGPEQRAATDP